MGGDNSPNKTIEGVKLFLEKNKKNNDFEINLFGNEEVLKQKIEKNNMVSGLINIHDSKSVVSDDEKPLTAVKNAKYKHVELYSTSIRWQI